MQFADPNVISAAACCRWRSRDLRCVARSEIKSKRRARHSGSKSRVLSAARAHFNQLNHARVRLQTERLTRRRPKPKDNHPVAGLHVAPAGVGSTREEIAETSYAGASLLPGARERWFSVNIYARETPPGAKLSGRRRRPAGFAALCEMNSLVRPQKISSRDPVACVWIFMYAWPLSLKQLSLQAAWKNSQWFPCQGKRSPYIYKIDLGVHLCTLYEYLNLNLKQTRLEGCI